MTDLTLAVTAHAETVVAGPTLTSARAALAPLTDAGYSVQLLMGLDSATEACRAYMTQGELADFEVLEVAFRDQGRTRNALAERARGRYLAFLDSDDLFSENWLIRAVELLEARPGERIIVHPELNWQFDGISNVYAPPDQDEPFFSPFVMPAANYYDALCVAPREAWAEVKYADRAVKEGYAFEDYQWFVEATAKGWRHAVARDTIIFKRRRDSSQTHESRENSVLIRTIPALAIDRLATMVAPRGKNGAP